MKTSKNRTMEGNLNLKQLRRNVLKSNNILIVLLFIFVMLYFNDHSKLQAVEQEAVPQVVIDHKKRLELRRARLQSVCSEYGLSMRVEHGSVFRRKKLVNRCTGSFFHVEGKDHFICNVLKGGSTSWQVFFGENNITRTFLEACEDNHNCPTSSTAGLKLVQVRHPLERLLATYRHIFKNGGWKALDLNYQGNPKLEQEYVNFFSKDWPYFVEEIVLKDEYHKTEEDLEELGRSGVWIKHHWAPYWYTCGLCSSGLAPDIVIKTETLPWDMPTVLERLKLPGSTSFPDIRVTGTDDNFSEGNKASEVFVEKYFSQLSKQQVMRLYEMYKLDHLMFDYSPQKYIDVAR
eukprot:TRINITY_DN21202_c0_g1_i1.p1 TRINITY_DN21202_c0_g1~~TRINITY_DN21202_c0_g1_i1.p1  ORF type:complete len:347 (-),score=75.10 TRINITY_DN21202_c0_g1_i1:75-1115(-)